MSDNERAVARLKAICNAALGKPRVDSFVVVGARDLEAVLAAVNEASATGDALCTTLARLVVAEDILRTAQEENDDFRAAIVKIADERDAYKKLVDRYT